MLRKLISAISLLGTFIPDFTAFKNIRTRWFKEYKVTHSKGRKITVTTAQQKRAAKKRVNKRKHPRG